MREGTLSQPHRSSRRAVLREAAVALFVSLFVSIGSVSAATITVNTTEDEFNSDGDCSLREAITAANTNRAVDACVPGVFGADTITFSITGTITLGSTLPPITDHLTITGPGASNLTINGNNAVRVMWNFALNLNLSVQGLTIANANADQGAGIRSERGTLTVSNCTFSNNRASAFGAGAILNNNATLIITNSTFFWQQRKRQRRRHSQRRHADREQQHLLEQ